MSKNGQLTTRITADDVLPSDERATPQERHILRAAYELYGARGVASREVIAKRAGISSPNVGNVISRLKRKGLWPYTSPYTRRRESDVEAAKPAAESKPLDTLPNPMVETFGLILKALDAIDRLPNEAKAALIIYLHSRYAHD